MKTIDSHHHFWHYDPVEYGWIGHDMAAIRRDFLPGDLEATIRAAGVAGVVSVQARQSLEETRWLLDLAVRNAFIRGIVGWVPLTAPDVADTLDSLCENPKLKAVRHVVQGEPDDAFILRADFNRGVAALKPVELTYDILIFERHLPQTIAFVDRHPGQRFVLDHVAKPKIKAAELEPWASNMRELARRPNVWCKVSGMVTEADYRYWTADQLRPYMDKVLEAFGPSRLMFGSDWPVCLLACDYARWLSIVQDFTNPLSVSERAAILGQNAIDAYRLEKESA